MKIKPKIGIFTFYDELNFGSLLQAHALKTVCSRFFPAELVMHPYCHAPFKFPLYLLCSLHKHIPGRIWHFITYGLYYLYTRWKQRKSDFSAYRTFLKRHIVSASQRKYAPWNIWKVTDDYDILVTGSDNVWLPQLSPTHDFIPAYFLRFPSSKRKNPTIAYAASFGGPELIPGHLHDTFKNYLGHLDHIACRERSATEFVRKLTGRNDICTTLDPTLLLPESYWRTIEKKPAHAPRDFIVLYHLHDGHYLIEIAKDYAMKQKKQLVVISGQDVGSIGPQSFLWYMRNAEFIITNSFHGMLFAINFKRQFKVFKPLAGLDRILSILTILEIDHNDVLSNDRSGLNFFFNLDYEKLHDKLYIQRKASLAFLENALNSNYGTAGHE